MSQNDSNDNADSRRNFFKAATRALVIAGLANAGIYAIGSSFKKVDGSLVAGAK